MIEPNVLTAISLVTGAFIASWAGVGLFRRWSVRRQLLDIPNERSSHSQPTPRGGGIVIALTGLAGYLITVWVFGVPFSPGFFFGAVLVAGVSWLDDLYGLPFWARLIVHIAAACALVADLGVWQSVPVPLSSAVVPLGTVAGAIVTIAWIVWLLNAYNFMDGIDGIAGLQAVVAGVAWAFVAGALGLGGTLLFAAVLAAVSFGFLIHNWQPARIFMGDVGSAFLGFTLAALPLLARHEAQSEMPALILIAVALVWFFVFDTVFTFLRRAIKGERVWEAHRSHLYQRLVIGGMSHRSVTVLYGLGSALTSICVFLALTFDGIFPALGVFLVVILTAILVYSAFRKKSLT
jgi:Fuc2NAc and GlcNAc transferase